MTIANAKQQLPMQDEINKESSNPTGWTLLECRNCLIHNLVIATSLK